MLEPSGVELDPKIFNKDHEYEFSLTIGFAVHQLEKSREVVRAYEGFDADVANAGLAQEIEDEGGEIAEAYEDLKEMVGENFITSILGSVTGDSEPPVTEEDYEAARIGRDEAAATLVDYTIGYHDFMKAGLVKAYGEDNEAADEEAWVATWRKIKDTLSNSEGTLLAEAAGFFDELVRKKFGDKYKPIEESRGPEVSSDICAKTFYVVMKDHLHRAIIGANRDEWTGYK